MLSSTGAAPSLRPASSAAPAPASVASWHRPFAAAQGLRPGAARPLCRQLSARCAGQGHHLLGQLHTLGMQPLSGTGGGGSDSEFHVNFGRAVRTLREDIPRCARPLYFSASLPLPLAAEAKRLFVCTPACSVACGPLPWGTLLCLSLLGR